MNARLMCVAAALVLGSSTMLAQVGSLPETSPFRDVEKRQDVTLFTGPSFGGHDKVGAAPRGGVAVGVRYDVPLGGSPLSFTASVLRQSAQRDVLQPGLPLAQRVGRTVSQPLWMFDAGFSLMLTGMRSWHGVMPSVNFAVSAVTDNRQVSDSSNFRFGNRFSPVVGFGVKYAPVKSRWTLRADVTNHFYGVSYPQTFRDTTPGAPRIVGVNTKSSWTRNTMLTLGIVREFGRR
jgi:hypothetical protein